MINKVEICGVNTSKLPNLTEKEKILLFEKIKDGDPESWVAIFCFSVLYNTPAFSDRCLS